MLYFWFILALLSQHVFPCLLSKWKKRYRRDQSTYKYRSYLYQSSRCCWVYVSSKRECTVPCTIHCTWTKYGLSPLMSALCLQLNIMDFFPKTIGPISIKWYYSFFISHIRPKDDWKLYIEGVQSSKETLIPVLLFCMTCIFCMLFNYATPKTLN